MLPIQLVGRMHSQIAADIVPLSTRFDLVSLRPLYQHGDVTVPPRIRAGVAAVLQIPETRITFDLGGPHKCTNDEVTRWAMEQGNSALGALGAIAGTGTQGQAAEVLSDLLGLSLVEI